LLSYFRWICCMKITSLWQLQTIFQSTIFWSLSSSLSYFCRHVVIVWLMPIWLACIHCFFQAWIPLQVLWIFCVFFVFEAHSLLLPCDLLVIRK
jgi:hypothetical protein